MAGSVAGKKKAVRVAEHVVEQVAEESRKAKEEDRTKAEELAEAKKMREQRNERLAQEMRKVFYCFFLTGLLLFISD